MRTIDTIEELERLYPPPGLTSTIKVTPHVTPHYRAMIEASPFVALATVGPEGIDCSPRGDAGAVVAVLDERTLVMPDRAGNNRADSLRNIVRDPRCAFLFLIPGSGNCLRVNGRAVLSLDDDLLESLAVDGRRPRCAIVLTTDEVYFQCARAIVRSALWDPSRQVDPSALPTAGEILAALSAGAVGGEAYDREWPERAARTLW